VTAVVLPSSASYAGPANTGRRRCRGPCLPV